MSRSGSAVLVAALLVLPAPGCAGPGQGGSPNQAEEEPMAEGTIESAQEELTTQVLPLPGVTGTAIGLCGSEPCIKVYLARPDSTLAERIPSTFRGFPVEIEVTGEFRPRDTLP